MLWKKHVSSFLRINSHMLYIYICIHTLSLSDLLYWPKIYTHYNIKKLIIFLSKKLLKKKTMNPNFHTCQTLEFSQIFKSQQIKLRNIKKKKKIQPNTTNKPIIKPPKQHPLSLSSTTKPPTTCHQ